MAFDFGGIATGAFNASVNLVTRSGVGRDIKETVNNFSGAAHFASGAGLDAISRWLSDPVNVENMAAATFSEVYSAGVVARHQQLNRDKLRDASKSIFSLHTPKNVSLIDPMRSYLWSFWVKQEEADPDLRAVFKRINKCNIPGMQFETIQKQVANQTFSMAGAKTLNQVNLTLYDDAQGTMKSLEYIYRWMAEIQDPATGGINPPGLYKKDAVIAVYRPVPATVKPGDATVMFIKLHGVWPQAVSDVQLDYDSSGLFTIDLTLSADRIGTAYFANPTGSKGFDSQHDLLANLIPSEVSTVIRAGIGIAETAQSAYNWARSQFGGSASDAGSTGEESVHAEFSAFDQFAVADPSKDVSDALTTTG